MKFRDILKDFIAGIKENNDNDNNSNTLEESGIPELLETPAIEKEVTRQVGKTIKDKVKRVKVEEGKAAKEAANKIKSQEKKVR